MKSISQLNTRGQTSLSYTDDRNATIVFDRTTPSNQSLTTAVGESHIQNPGILILDIIKPDSLNIYYEIDVGSVSGATVSWASLPSGVTLNNLGSGKYRIVNIDTVAQWNAIKSPTVNIPSGWEDNFVYTAGIYYDPSKSKTWTTSIVVTVRALLTSNLTLTGTLTGIQKSYVNAFATTTVSVNNQRARLASSSMASSTALVSSVRRNLGAITAQITSRATITATGSSAVRLSAAINSTSTLNIIYTRVRTRNIIDNVVSTATLSLKIFNKLTPPTSASLYATINNNGTYYATGGTTGVNLYNVNTRSLVRTLGSSWGGTIRMSSSYTGLPAQSSYLKIYNNSTGALTTTINNPGPSGNIWNSLDAQMTDTYTAIADLGFDESGMPTNTGRVYIYSTTTGSQVRTINIPYTPIDTNERWGDGLRVQGNNIFIGTGYNGSPRLYVYSMSTGSLVYSINSLPTYAYYNRIEVNSNYIFVPVDYNDVAVYDISNGSYIKTLTLDARTGYSSNSIKVSDTYIMRYDIIYNMNATLIYTLKNPDYTIESGLEEFNSRALASNKLLLGYTDSSSNVSIWAVNL